MRSAFKNLVYLCILVGLSVTLFLVHCGLEALTVTVPPQAKANERVTFVMHCGTDPIVQGDPTQLLAGIMVPKSWNARQNAELRYTSPKGNGTMQLIADTETEQKTGMNWPQAAKSVLGIGPNLVDDFEWIVYRSLETYSFNGGEKIAFDVQAECNVGSENMLVRLGFYVGSSREAFEVPGDFHKVAFSDVFEVTDGEGELIDFVNPQLGVVQPVQSLDNDIITLTFDGGVVNTVLDNTADVYLHVRAFDEAGLLFAEVGERTAKTRLRGVGGKRFLIDIWPRGFFAVPKGKRIARIEYFFTDDMGTKTVGYGNMADPFKYTFRCD